MIKMGWTFLFSASLVAACASADAPTDPIGARAEAVTVASTPMIRIVKTDPRVLQNLTITADLAVEGQPHSDFEQVGTFDHATHLKLDARGASWNGTAWVGDLLATQTAAGGPPIVFINKVEPRSVTSLRLRVDFDIDGQPHTDVEDITPFDAGTIDLQINALGGSWNGTAWVGDFLRRVPKVRVKKADPRPITDLQLTAQYVVGGVTQSDGETIGAFDRSVHLALDGRGRWGGSVADTLSTEFAAPGLPLITIDKADPRAVSGLRLTASFRINGELHQDYEDVGDLNAGIVDLALDGRNASWNGTAWVGDLLRHTSIAPGADTLPDPSVRILTQHQDVSRSGANVNEKVLTPANVGPGSFGKLFTLPVDGQVYAQPLYVGGQTVNGVVRDVVYLATMHNGVYAYDANTSALLWQTSLAPSFPIWTPALCDVNGATPCAMTDATWGNKYGNYHDIAGEIGIVGTPVIDPVTQRMYLVAYTAAGGTYRHLLYALDARSGGVVGGPVQIAATFPGHGDGSVNGVLTFDSKRQHQRPGLLLANGRLVIAFASFADTDPYHGWVLAYDAATLTRVGTFNTTPEAAEGGIWMAGQGPSVDAAGNVYLMTGNSTPPGDYWGTSNPAPTAGSDLGESFVKLRGTDLALLDWFTPKNFVELNKDDTDLGSAGPILIPGTNRLLGGGKEGRLYVLNTDNLGHFDASTDNVLQSFQATDPNVGTHHIHGAPVYVQTGATALDARLFVWGESNQVRAFPMTAGVLQETPDAQSTLTDDEVARGGMPGGILTYSGNGATNGIVWGTHVLGGAAQGTYEAGRFWAFDALTLKKLWSSTDVPQRDDIGRFAKFAPPTVANGRVYVASFSNAVSVYGLLE